MTTVQHSSRCVYQPDICCAALCCAVLCCDYGAAHLSRCGNKALCAVLCCHTQFKGLVLQECPVCTHVFSQVPFRLFLLPVG
jgi:hypothetical protein